MSLHSLTLYIPAFQNRNLTSGWLNQRVFVSGFRALWHSVLTLALSHEHQSAQKPDGCRHFRLSYCLDGFIADYWRRPSRRFPFIWCYSAV